MHNFKIENFEGTETLVYTLSEDQKLDNLSLSMLKDKKIVGFLPVTYTQMDEEKCLNYDIAGMTSAHDTLASNASIKKLIGIYTGIIDALESINQYMLLEDSVVLDDKYVFCKKNEETRLVCLPIYGLNESVDIRRFFKNFLIDYTYDQPGDDALFKQITSFLNSDNFSLDEFRKFLKRMQTENMGSNNGVIIKKAPVKEKPVLKPAVEEGKPVEKPIEKPIEKYVEKNVEKIKAIKESDNEETEKEKPMSVVDLLSNFSGENLKKYKAQKAEAKQEKLAEKEEKKKNKNVKETKEKKKSSKNDVSINPAFAVPGRDNNQNKAQTEIQKKEINTPSVTPKKVEEKMPKALKIKEKENIAIKEEDYGATVVLNEDNESAILGNADKAEAVEKAYLVSRKDNSYVEITSSNFSIGRDKANADFCIDNDTISRQHAEIEKDGNTYYIANKKPGNHTYLNGKEMAPWSKEKLNSGDELRFAEEVFDFEIR